MLKLLVIILFVMSGFIAEANEYPRIEGACDPEIAEEALKIAKAAFHSPYFHLSDSRKSLIAQGFDNILFPNSAYEDYFENGVDSYREYYLSKPQNGEPKFLIKLAHTRGKDCNLYNAYLANAAQKSGFWELENSNSIFSHFPDNYHSRGLWAVKTRKTGQIFFLTIPDPNEYFGASLYDIDVVPLLAPAQFCEIKFAPLCMPDYEEEKLWYLLEFRKILDQILGRCRTDCGMEDPFEMAARQGFSALEMAIYRPWSLADKGAAPHNSSKAVSKFLERYGALTAEQAYNDPELKSEREYECYRCEKWDKVERQYNAASYARQAQRLYKLYKEFYPLAEKDLTAHYYKHYKPNLKEAQEAAKKNLDFIVRSHLVIE